jgi:tRNA pseudouridine32 synthase / 23S rRNA pseudouridine746 synthase
VADAEEEAVGGVLERAHVSRRPVAFAIAEVGHGLRITQPARGRIGAMQRYISAVIRFSPAPEVSELPTRFPSPFDRAAVHPLARRAATEMLDALQSSAYASWALHAPGNGKMFGVLVVAAPDGAIGYLRGFSGMISGRWDIEGWAPPVFDAVARDAVWIDGEAEMHALAAERAAVARSAANDHTDAALRTIDLARADRSRELLPLIQATYRITNALGDTRPMRELFAPAEPPGGAGDCAAPKLLAHAYRHDLRPLALAEVWCGAPPRTGDRRSGSFYPACHGKCGPILAHMLTGLPADAPPLYGSAPIAASEPALVYEDDQIVIVSKPCGLLSVPGRSARLQDCVLTRLRARYPDATGPLLVHRLDLDTSGLMLAAKDADTFAALQRLFAYRTISKRYIAWLDGDVVAEEGVIELPLRLDLDDRPRQIHDPEFGRAAVTEWQVLERAGGRTKVALTPHTGRTHQLRVHTSHPLGLDAPIVGDRLYGRVAPEEGERLMLHAESLVFAHPGTGARVSVKQPAPF